MSSGSGSSTSSTVSTASALSAGSSVPPTTPTSRVPYIWSDTTHNRTLKKIFLTCKTFFIIHHFKEQECLTCSSKFQALTKFSAEVTWLKRRLTDHPKNRSIFSIFRTRNFAHYLVQFQTIPSKPQEPWSISKKLMQHSWHFLLLHRKTRVIKVAVLLIYIRTRPLD